MLDWDVSDKDFELIQKIIQRGRSLSICTDSLNTTMDITAAHKSGPLDLTKFLTFDNFSFMHDFLGISKHMNRISGELCNCFLPRCARNASNS